MIVAGCKKIFIFDIVPPRKVALTIDGIPRSEYTFKMIEQGEKKLSIDCIARQATPTPVFEWKLGGSLIEVRKLK